MKFNVKVEKRLTQIGTIEIEAASAAQARFAVLDMMSDIKHPLQTVDPRITWNDPEYEDFTFGITGEADEVA